MMNFKKLAAGAAAVMIAFACATPALAAEQVVIGHNTEVPANVNANVTYINGGLVALGLTEDNAAAIKAGSTQAIAKIASHLNTHFEHSNCAQTDGQICFSSNDLEGDLFCTGNLNVTDNGQVKGDIIASGDMTFSNCVNNYDGHILFSQAGSIHAYGNNASLNGLIFAPKGEVVLNCAYNNLNNVVVIAKAIRINTANGQVVNANPSQFANDLIANVIK